MFDTEMDIREEDMRLLDIHSGIYPFVHYSYEDGTWCIESCDYDEQFDSYEDFISFIEEELKESLLNYALNGELGMLAESLGEEI